jgi:hypothetical protein
MRTEEGERIVKEIVEEWSKIYTKQVQSLGTYGNILQYEVEFSKPLVSKPIPEQTVRVIFNIIQHNDGSHEVEFNFENESLKHKLNNSMRTMMFESWIGRILENKHKIKQELYLGTEFEAARFVDAKGAKMDPFIPHFDITKMQMLQNECEKSQKINVESPRFISTLERALVKLFSDIDTENTGLLTYKQFYNSFKDLKYELTENDIRAMVALA